MLREQTFKAKLMMSLNRLINLWWQGNHLSQYLKNFLRVRLTPLSMDFSKSRIQKFSHSPSLKKERATAVGLNHHQTRKTKSPKNSQVGWNKHKCQTSSQTDNSTQHNLCLKMKANRTTLSKALSTVADNIILSRLANSRVSIQAYTLSSRI